MSRGQLYLIQIGVRHLQHILWNISVGWTMQTMCIDSCRVGGCEIHFPKEKNNAYLLWIFINEEIRGKGIGSSCMDALKAELLERGIVQLDTDTAVDNLIAQHFYEKNHFIKRGLTRSYYQKIRRNHESIVGYVVKALKQWDLPHLWIFWGGLVMILILM